MRRDHPVLADDTLERDQVFVFLFTGRVDRHVHLAAAVVKHRSPLRGRQPRARRILELERIGDLRRALAATAADVGPKKLRAVQPLRPVRQILKVIDPLAVALITRFPSSRGGLPTRPTASIPRPAVDAPP